MQAWGRRLTIGFLLLAPCGCGGRLLSLAEQDGGGSSDASVDGDDGSSDASSDDGPRCDTPLPVPVCTGQLSMCLPPNAGVVWQGASVIQCQPPAPNNPCPVTLLLERQSGTGWQFVKSEYLYFASEATTIYDTTAPPTMPTYRVCVQDSKTSARCGAPFATEGAPMCYCEPTNCSLLTACNTKIYDGCGNWVQCGACANGTPCNSDTQTCCPPGFMSNLWGGCVCAPPPSCPIWNWVTTTCTCVYSSG